MKKLLIIVLATLALASCSGIRKSINSGGGEVTGVGAVTYSEPTPYGMVLVDCGSMKEGPSQRDSLWGIDSTARGVSVDAFWMDENEVTNSKYKQFVYWVRDSIIRARLAVATKSLKSRRTRMATPSSLTLTGVETFLGKTQVKMRSAL